MDKLKSGNSGSLPKTPNNGASKAGAACVKAMKPSGNTGKQGAEVRKSGNKG